MSIAVHHGDCLAVIPELVARGIVVDATVCDPPYHLTPTVSRFGKAGSAPAKHGRDGAMARLSSGFMSAKWDGGDTAFRPETWATVASIMRPGAFLVAFGGTRTVHRLASAIEDAGFIIQDSILDLIATDARVRLFLETLSASQSDAFSQILDDLQPTGALAWAFGTGFPKRREMLKPAYEPIVLAYKPGGKRTMQVDECRIGTSEIRTGSGSRAGNMGWGTGNPNGNRYTDGRWPANICHDGSDEVIAAFPKTGKSPPVGSMGGGSNKHSIYGDFAGVRHENGYGDSGSAARFFFSAKAGAQDRWGSRHPTVKPVELMKWLVALVCPPGGLVLDPFAGSGTTAVAALGTGRNAILIEREDQYVADIRERLAFYEGEGRHSMVSRNRHKPAGIGALRDAGRLAAAAEERAALPLFATAPAPTEYDEPADALGSFNEAMRVIGEQVKAGAPVPEFLLSRRVK